MTRHQAFINARKYQFADRVSILERNWLQIPNRPEGQFVLSLAAARSAYRYATAEAQAYVNRKKFA